jgi:hypothetical protein
LDQRSNIQVIKRYKYVFKNFDLKKIKDFKIFIDDTDERLKERVNAIHNCKCNICKMSTQNGTKKTELLRLFECFLFTKIKI